jgi:ketosteroid isomerase-like protein
MRTGLQQAYESLDSDVESALKEVETMATKQKTHRGIGLAVAASAVVIAGLVWGPGLVGSLGGWSGAPVAGSTEDPAAVLAAYEDARNARDFDALRALYADDAVITGYPLDASDPPVADVDEIVSHERGVFAQTSFVEVEVSGRQATFTLLFLRDGDCEANADNQITVEDGEITSYTWGGDYQPCNAEQLVQAAAAE